MPGKQIRTGGKAPVQGAGVERGLSYAYTGSEQPLIGETIGHMFERIAKKHPDNEALVYLPTGVRYTYREFHEICRAAAKSFIALGVRKGDRVAVWATNHPEWAIAQFSTALVGAILVTVNPAYKTHELEYGLKNAEVQTLILIPRFKSSEYAQMINQLVPELKDSKPGELESRAFPNLKTVIMLGEERHAGTLPWAEFMRKGESVSDGELAERAGDCDFDDVINVQYTSGTTGLPKGASLTHHNILNNAHFVAEGMHFTDKDRLCIPVPLYHCFGMVLSSLLSVTHGATMVFPSEYYDALLVLEAVEKERCTALHGVPTMFIAELE
ncbi:MAG: AMP-binding protein, partial [Candidatus Krumholzibacteriia bacterium]